MSCRNGVLLTCLPRQKETVANYFYFKELLLKEYQDLNRSILHGNQNTVVQILGMNALLKNTKCHYLHGFVTVVTRCISMSLDF